MLPNHSLQRGNLSLVFLDQVRRLYVLIEGTSLQLADLNLPMSFMHIDLITGKPPEHCGSIGQIVYAAMVQVLKKPENERFQIIAEHDAKTVFSSRVSLASTESSI